MVQAAIHDFFRNIRLESPDGVTVRTLEADTTTDTLTIKLANGISFFDTDVSTDTFGLDVNYEVYVPVGSTTLRLQDVNSNTTDVKLTPGLGLNIQRLGNDELIFTSYGVAENDTLHSITERGAITSNKLIISDIEIGDIVSTTGVDGFSALSSDFQGDGTLDNPARLIPTLTESTNETYTDTFEFSVDAAGILSYSASYLPPAGLSTGAILLEREDPLNPGTWATIAQQTGTVAGNSYQIANTYSETYTGGTVNYRITVEWTGNPDLSKVLVNAVLYYEVYDVATNILFQTDTTSDEIYINGNIGIETFNPAVSLDINRTDAIKLPAGATAERPATGADGYIRFNTDTNKYEGYTDGFWRELGSVSDVDLNTYITAELNPGDNDNTIRFYTDDNLSLSLSSSLLDVKTDVQVKVNNATESTDTATGALVVDGGVGIVKNLNVGGTLDVTGQSTLASVNVEDLTDNRIVIAGTSGELEDDANFTFDGTTFNIGATGEFTVDVATGNSQIKGTLDVDGQSTLASVNVEDLTSGRVVLAGTDGEIEDSANLTFDGTLLTVTGNQSITGTLDVDTSATIASLNVEDLTSGRVVLAGTSGEIEDSANLTFDGTDLTASSLIVSDLTDNRIVIAGPSGAVEDDANFTFDGTTFNVGQGNLTVDVATGNAYTAGTFQADGDATLNANVIIGDGVTDTVTFNSRVASVFTPEVTATHALGEDALRWSDLFVSDTVNVADYTLPLADGTVNQIIKTDAQGQLFFSDADSFGGNRVYVSAAKGDDANDGVTAPVASIKRAAQIAAELAYSPVTTDPTVEAETQALRAAAQTIADDTITYINTTYPALVYDQAKCNRDVKEIINSAIYDLRFGGNSRSVAAGEYYYDGTGTLYITGQESETIDAINYAKSLAVTYLTGARATAIGASFDTVTSIITNIANAPAKTYGNYVTNQITIMVASGDYVEQNPIILGDDISIVGDNLRRVIIRPANENLDIFRVRNSSYITGVVFRDGLTAGVPDFTFRYALSFDNVIDTATSRAGYTNLPVSRPKIFTSPYIQNCSVISFLGGNGVEVDGDLIDTPNTPPNNIEAENPVNLVDGIPEQGKSMVANAFTILSFGGVAWRIINDAYAQIVSCFVIFTENGCIAQNGGYLSITNSASNFGLFALRASGFSPNAFEFDRGIIEGNGIYEGFQTLKFIGLKRAPLEHFVVRVRNNSNIDITSTFKNDSTFGNTASIVPTISNVGGNTITFSSAHGFQTGEVVEYNSNGNVEIVGLLSEMTYYASVPNSTQLQLFNDEDFLRPVRDLDASPTSGTHEFKSGYEEFFVNEVVSSHNTYQTLTIPADSYSITPGDVIQATDGATTISATIYSFDAIENKLVVSINLVQTGTASTRNTFTTNSVIDAGEISAGTVNVISVSNRADLWSSEVAIISTKNRPMQSIGNTTFNQIYLHRPSIVNSSAHTWEYAGSGTDYNALPQNGGQTIEFFEQVSTLPGRVYSSGTNELGDFKVGDFVRAFNRTGNIEFKNKVAIGELDSLALSLSSGVVVDEISTDIDLGDNEVGGAQHNRLVTQLAARSFIENRLGNFIDQNLSTNAVPNAVVQLNGQGTINAELIPPSSGTSAFRLDSHNGRLLLHEDIPSIDLKSGDIVIEEYQETVLTLTGAVTVVAGETVTQANSGATGVVKDAVTSGTTVRIIEPFSGTFNTTDELTGSTSGALGANSVPSVVSGPNDVTDNYFLATANASQFLILDPTDTYDFTDIIANSTPVTGALTNATGTATEHRVGVVTALDILNLSGGNSYLTPGAYQNVALTSVTGTGTGVLADIVVNGAGSVDSIDVTFGGSGYAAGDTLSAAANDIGGIGGGGTEFEIDVLDVENRLYVDLEPTIGIQFNATELNVEFTVDDNATSLTLDQTGETNFGFDAADVGVGGDVTYSNSRITLTTHNMADGDPVRYDSGANSPIGGLTNGDTYFVKVIDVDTIELYTNYALNSKVVFISASTGTHQLKIDFVNLTDEVFYIQNHGLTTGKAIQYNATTPVTGISDGDYLFAGSVTQNSFTLHSARGSALDSINGITVNPINLSADGSGNASLVIQNAEIIGKINTSGKEESSWSNLSATNIDAEDIISGIVSTSRLATGSANNLTFLRGDSTWSTAVQGMIAEAPVTLTGQSFNDGTNDVYYNEVEVSVELASYDNPAVPSAGTETVGVAAFDFNHFDIDANGLVTTKSSSNSGVIDAATLEGQGSGYYRNPINFSRPIPIEIGGTNRISYNQGDLLYAATNIGAGSYTESLSSLTIGSANSILQSNGTTPEWTDSLTLADLTVGNIQVAVTGDNEIDTTSGNLTIDSAGGTVTVDDNLTVSGTTTLNGDIDLGDANTDTVTFTAKVDSTILPSANDTYDLGATSEAWKDIYLSESVIFEGATGENTIDVPTNLADTLSITDGTTDYLVITSTTGSEEVKVDTNLVVTGNLQVDGTTTTVNSTTVTVDDPIFTLGGDTAPTTDDNKDRGIEFNWHDGANAKVGFFGFDDSTGKFTFIPDATNTAEVFSGTQGTIDVTAVEAGNVQVGVTDAQTIDTASGNLVLDSASGLTVINDNVVDFNSLARQIVAGLDSIDTNQKAIASFSSTFSGGKFVISFTQGTARHITELLVTHDGTTAIATEYGTVFTGTSQFTLDVDISGGNVRVLATPATATLGTFRVSGQVLV